MNVERITTESGAETLELWDRGEKLCGADVRFLDYLARRAAPGSRNFRRLPADLRELLTCWRLGVTSADVMDNGFMEGGRV